MAISPASRPKAGTNSISVNTHATKAERESTMTELAVQIFDNWNDFEPRPYLDAWYAQVTPEITATCKFLIESYRQVAPGARMIDFCCGPTIYQHIAAAAYVADMHASDFLAINLRETQLWLDQAANAFDWTPILGEVLRLEGNPTPSPAAIEQQAALVRQKLTALALCDIREQHPLGQDVGRIYDVVSHCYGADVVASTVAEWESYVENCCSVLKPNGRLIMTLIKDAEWWPSGDQIMPAVVLNESHVLHALVKIGFDPASIVIETHTVDEVSEVGYSDVIFVTATLGAGVAA
jgi:hypothetical protein